MGTMTGPPNDIVDAAIDQATRSPCAKSKRGVAIYVTDRRLIGGGRGGAIVGMGRNGPPPGISCDSSERCRSSCRHRCEHAESRALLWAMTRLDPYGLADFKSCDLVHVKIDDSGQLVAGGGPSCVPCAVRILDVGLAGVWLYELGVPSNELRDATQKDIAVLMRPHWQRYIASEFHRISCQTNGVYLGS